MVLGIDVGKVTGYCIMDNDGKVVKNGSFIADNLVKLYNELVILTENDITAIVTDTIMYRVGAKALEKLAIVKLVGEQKMIPVVSMPANQMRKAVLGTGKKVNIRKLLKEKYSIVTENVHSADAIISCIAYLIVARRLKDEHIYANGDN